MKGIVGLFVGLTTLDLIYLVAAPPAPNQKIVAIADTIAAGGPATNAAVAFCYLGGEALLLSAIGDQAITPLVRSDLQHCQVNLIDLAPVGPAALPVSSILVTQATGERAVTSTNVVNQIPLAAIPANLLKGVDIVLIDGHQMAVGAAIAEQAQAQNIPVVIDGGSWKPGFETVLPWVNYAICSSNFYPPDCQTTEQVVAYLTQVGITQIAITRGEQPIIWQAPRLGATQRDRGQIPVPVIKAVDTLGAGDVFHGAFCYFILSMDFPAALAAAAQVAGQACQSFGTRQWLNQRL
jgi:sugar/nucleoside kinase (ribokinase family)